MIPKLEEMDYRNMLEKAQSLYREATINQIVAEKMIAVAEENLERIKSSTKGELNEQQKKGD